MDLLAAPGFDSYPITSFSYLILHSDLGEVRSIDDRAQAQAVIDMIAWMITDGQQYSSRLLYVPIADTVSNIGLRGLAQITYNGEQLYTGATSVWYSEASAGAIDDSIADLHAQYADGMIDQSTFLNLMAQIAKLHELYEQDLIDDNRLADILINIFP